MTAIGSTYQDGVDVRAAAHVNSLGLAFKAMGITDDDTGDLIVPRGGFDLPFAIRSAAAASVVEWGLGPSSSVTVGAGQFVFVFELTTSGTPGSAPTVTPSGGSAINVAGTTGPFSIAIGLCLGAGDQIALGTNTHAAGIELPAAQIIGSPTRILKFVDNTTTHTTGAGTRTLLTHAWPTAALGLVTLSIAGVSQRSARTQGGQATGGIDPQVFRPRWITASKTIAGGSTDDWLISGLEFTI